MCARRGLHACACAVCNWCLRPSCARTRCRRWRGSRRPARRGQERRRCGRRRMSCRRGRRRCDRRRGTSRRWGGSGRCGRRRYTSRCGGRGCTNHVPVCRCVCLYHTAGTGHFLDGYSLGTTCSTRAVLTGYSRGTHWVLTRHSALLSGTPTAFCLRRVLMRQWGTTAVLLHGVLHPTVYP